MGWCVSYWNSISLTTARVENAGGLSLAQQLCPSHIAASYQDVASLRKSSSTSPTCYARCLHARSGNWKLFSHPKCHHDFMTPVSRVTHSFLGCLASEQPGRPRTLCYLPLSTLQIPGVTAPRSFTRAFNPPVSSQAAVLLSAVHPLGRARGAGWGKAAGLHPMSVPRTNCKQPAVILGSSVPNGPSLFCGISSLKLQSRNRSWTGMLEALPVDRFLPAPGLPAVLLQRVLPVLSLQVLYSCHQMVMCSSPGAKCTSSITRC